jgi:hypothetical protein
MIFLLINLKITRKTKAQPGLMPHSVTWVEVGACVKFNLQLGVSFCRQRTAPIPPEKTLAFPRRLLRLRTLITAKSEIK